MPPASLKPSPHTAEKLRDTTIKWPCPRQRAGLPARSNSAPTAHARGGFLRDSRLLTEASVSSRSSQAVAADEDQASAGAQSAPTALLHPWKAAVTLPLSRSMRLGVARRRWSRGQRAAAFVWQPGIGVAREQALRSTDAAAVGAAGAPLGE
jgi:hypothetical protein